MVTKRIIVEGGGGVKLSNDSGLVKFLKAKGVECLVNDGNAEVYEFESLVDNGTYTLGPKTQVS